MNSVTLNGSVSNPMFAQVVAFDSSNRWHPRIGSARYQFCLK
jgi:hypothetical protein